GGAVGKWSLLEQDHPLHATRGQRVGDAGAVDAAADDDDVRGVHAHRATTAVASISTRMSSRTNFEISTRVLAGGCGPKYSLRATFTFSRSAMFLRNTVTLQTSAKVAPAAARHRLIFSSACRAWAVASSPPTVRPWASDATQPDTKTMLPARTTWVKWLIGSDMPGTRISCRWGLAGGLGRAAARLPPCRRLARLALSALPTAVTGALDPVHRCSVHPPELPHEHPKEARAPGQARIGVLFRLFLTRRLHEGHRRHRRDPQAGGSRIHHRLPR